MAQPIFDQHPLEEYFQQSGEAIYPMPGDFLTFTAETEESDPQQQEIDLQLPPFLLKVLQLVNSLLPPSTYQSPGSTFAERFKYDVISSSLLSTSISAAPSVATRRTFTPELPGKLDDSRGSSDGGGEDTSDEPCHRFPAGHNDISSSFLGLPWHAIVASVAMIVVSAGYYFLCLLLSGIAIYMYCNSVAESDKADAMDQVSVQGSSSSNHNYRYGWITQTLDAVNELISAGNVWDSTMSEAINIIENEERSLFYGATSSQSPSSGLRVALQSSLYTTQTQCDNVRQLLSALTSPSQLPQLAEMYAPSSPIKLTFSLNDHPRPSSRPVSVPEWRQHNPTALLNKRKQNRLSDMSALFDPTLTPTKLSSVSTPVSPQSPSPQHSTTLQDVQEDDLIAPELTEREYFGAAALDLRRKRLPHPQLTPSCLTDIRLTFTSHLCAHHPTSPILIRATLALQGALSAKRYACAHLLALRFEEDEDDAYWEDVRSIMSLLTSTFADASTRLVEALDDAEKSRIKDARPSPASLAAHSRDSSLSVSPLRLQRASRTMAEMVSFAPMPSHLTRFAAHVDAISCALNDAREQLEQCVVSLRDVSSQDSIPNPASVQEYPAFQAYDRLRKELGLALRECERGRERLLDILAGPQRTQPTDDLEHSSPDTPGLGQDSSSDESEKFGPSSPFIQLGVPGERDDALGLDLSVDRGDRLDDATAHLLLTATSQHLPPPGAEQVFEADSGTGTPFTREKSKLSREERIQLAKARRESNVFGMPSMESSAKPSMERWGPGGEVVQELKDVIWKVSEKRRKMTEQPAPDARLQESQHIPVVAHTPRTTDSIVQRV
ncbi:hypothetical protein A0H81_06451 [Grifola frondosa]|uniref:Myosin-binding domain-containing protein n=1 Tax=Grifola frondosa TaxID=5627 RepID=A0A1C7MB76_GRIFR|nr:hypothetical protein A0H81_06451 [Grifola frondosa]